MKNIKLLFILASLAACSFAGFAQKASNVLDGIYIKDHAPTRKVIPYTHLREADVMWLKRIWREVDLREKINHPMYYPIAPINDRKSLFDVIKDAMVNEGTITPYSIGAVGTDDEFTQQLTIDEVKALLSRIDTQYVEDINTGEMVPQIVQTDITTDKVKMYRMKEEWFFDKQKSVMEVRIIGIAPMKEMFNQAQESLGYAPIFWIYFPEARFVFANAAVFNRFNDSERRTYEDIFWKRQFGSFIIKESNVYDRGIKEYKLNLDALLEAERIKDDIFIMEHDLWNF